MVFQVHLIHDSTYADPTLIPPRISAFSPSNNTYAHVPIFGFAPSSTSAESVYREAIAEKTDLVPFKIEFKAQRRERGPAGNYQYQYYDLCSVQIVDAEDEDTIPLGMTITREPFNYWGDIAWNNTNQRYWQGVRLKFSGTFAPDQKGLTITSREGASMPTTTHNPASVVGQVIEYEKRTNLSKYFLTFKVIDEESHKYYGIMALAVYPTFGEPWPGFPDPYVTP